MMKSFSVRNSGINHQISVLERQRSRLKFQEEEQLNEGGESFTYLIGNDDVLGYPLLENQWNDEFGSQIEVGYPLQRTVSCPPDVVAREGDEAAGREGLRKRKGAYRKAKMEEKKMKGCEEDESRMTEQNSNCKSTTTNAAGSSGSAAAVKRGNPKASDAPKSDYIHVRARRGQATDSHSLAERVRREKISERMKYLQDLVPGCNKITGKAGMLDEIINYVQSLQKQVEFLSMKLAAVNPQLEFDMESYPSKEIYPPCTSSFPTIGASSVMDPLLSHRIPGLVLDTNTNAAGAILRRIMSAPPVTIPDTSFDSSSTWNIQHLNWEDELQNLVAMDWQQGRESIFAGNVKDEDVRSRIAWNIN